jgi:hypothetical protein
MPRCINTEASHYERHLAIAKLIDDVNNGDEQAPVQKRKKARKHENDSDFSACGESTFTDTSSNDNDPLTEDLDISVRAGERFSSPSERRSLKRSLKEKRSQEKAFKNQQKFVVSVSQFHVDRVARVIHGAHYNVDKIGGHPGAEEKDVDAIFKRNDAYNAAIKAHRIWLNEQVRGSRARTGKKGVEVQKRQYSEDVESGLQVEKHDVEQLVSSILVQLGLHDQTGDAVSSKTSIDSSTPNRNRKQKASLLLKLRREIAADIEKSENERRATEQRMEGYWRYVNGTVTDRLANNARSVDRATGVKLKRDDCRLRLRETLDVDQAEDLEMEAVANDYEKLTMMER